MSTSRKSTNPTKRQRSNVNPDTAYLQFLKHPRLSQNFIRYSSKDCHQERFIRFQDFSNYDLSNLFESTGLLHLFSDDNMVPCYPFLVRLFYTNMEISTTPRFLETTVKNIPIKLTPQRIGNLLNIPFTGKTLDKIEMNNPSILHDMLNDGEQLAPGMFTRSFRPLPRLIGRIIANNILQKSGSFTYVSEDLAKYVYAIMGGIEVNWARVIYDNLTKPVSSSLDHGCILTHIFTSFNVPLNTESDIMSDVVLFDRHVFKRMDLPENPNPVPQYEVEEEDEDEEDEAPPPSHYASSSRSRGHGQSSFDFSDLQSSVDHLAHNQEHMMVTQDRLVASHYVMQHQLSSIRENQERMMKRFDDFFPPQE